MHDVVVERAGHQQRFFAVVGRFDFAAVAAQQLVGGAADRSSLSATRIRLPRRAGWPTSWKTPAWLDFGPIDSPTFWISLRMLRVC